MALRQYRIPAFYGVHQGMAENRINEGESPDACNMETAGGRLSVAKGYVRASDTLFPAPEEVKRLFVWSRAGGEQYLCATGQKLYALNPGALSWTLLYTFSASQQSAQADFQIAKIGNTEYLLLATGVSQIVKWDGTSETAEPFGSAAGLSDAAVGCIELYCSRLFAAGDAAHPARLYYSQVPGDERSIENWSSAEASENASGGFAEIGTDSDPITGLFALSNQLLILKRDSIYRLLGDRPGNFRIQPVASSLRRITRPACARAGDVLYFLTEDGLYYFDGQSVNRKADAAYVEDFLGNADLTACAAAACRDRLYFAVREQEASGANDALLVCDLSRGTYMFRRGFLARGLAASGGMPYILDGAGAVCRFDEGDAYAGARIDAYWKTPMTDLDSKAVNKRLEELFLRGSGGILSVEAITEIGTVYDERLMPGAGEKILELRLTGDGRAFQLVFRNVNGSHFTIDGGVELVLDAQRRVL